MLMSEKYRVHRDVIIERVREMSGVDVRLLGTEQDAAKAIEALVRIKDYGLQSAHPQNDQ
jgi:hypothetical protein